MITPPLNMWARPFFVAQVDVWRVIRCTFPSTSRGACRPPAAGSSPVREARCHARGELSHGALPFPIARRDSKDLRAPTTSEMGGAAVPCEIGVPSDHAPSAARDIRAAAWVAANGG